jgi:valyl-tRNA synthetase
LDDFCDWYIELSKNDVTSTEASGSREEARSRLITILEQALRLLHPFMPYITEELWQRLPGSRQELLHNAYKGSLATVMLTAYPEPKRELINERAEWEMQAVIDVISRVRNIRSEMNIKPTERVAVLIGSPDQTLREVFLASQDQIKRLARASDVSVKDRPAAPRASARAVLVGGAELAIPLEGLIDFEQETKRLIREQDKLRAEATKLEAQLANPSFVERAPAERVNEVRGRIADIGARTSQLQQTIENLR